MSLQVGIPLFVIAGLLQASVLPHLRIFGGQPDLIVVLVLIWASLDDDNEGIVWALIGGVFIDLFSGVPLGYSSLILVPIAFIVSLAEAQVYRNNVILPFILSAVGSATYHIGLMIVLRFVVGVPLAWSEMITYVTLPSVLFNTVLILPLLPILRRWYDQIHTRQVRVT